MAPLIEMGARGYMPTLGRFLEVDPVEGGNLNDYVYPSDPVNQFELDGRRNSHKGNWFQRRAWTSATPWEKSFAED
jgi:hypothetical protein